MATELSKKTKSEIVEKTWGREIIFANNSQYCGKILSFDAGKCGSMHYHVNKKETWYVSKGEFIFTWIDPETATTYKETLHPGDVITNERGHAHQLRAITDSEIFEVSTEHKDNDSFRIYKDK